MEKRKNYTFIVASSICVFLLLIVIAGNFGGKGTRADGEASNGCNLEYSISTEANNTTYCCKNESKKVTEKYEKEKLKGKEVGSIVFMKSEEYYQIVEVNPSVGEEMLGDYTVNTCKTKDSITGSTNSTGTTPGGQEPGSSSTGNGDGEQNETQVVGECTEKNLAGCKNKTTCNEKKGYWSNSISKCMNESECNAASAAIDNDKKTCACQETKKYWSTINNKCVNESECTSDNGYLNSIVNTCNKRTSNVCTVNITGNNSVFTNTEVTLNGTVEINSNDRFVKDYEWTSTNFTFENDVNLTQSSLKFNSGTRTFNNAIFSLKVTLKDGQGNATDDNCIGFHFLKIDVNSSIHKVTFYNGTSEVSSTTCTEFQKTLGCNVVAPAAPKANNGYRFNGWGSTANCEEGFYSANYTILNIKSNKEYYACFTKEEEKPTIEKEKCVFSKGYIVPLMAGFENYAGCKHYTITYNKEMSTSYSYAKECCTMMKYKWIGENYVTVAKGPYCIDCSNKSNNNTPGGSNTGTNGGSNTGTTGNTEGNPTKNQPTGATLIFVVWSIGIAMLVYAYWYFKFAKEN